MKLFDTFTKVVEIVPPGSKDLKELLQPIKMLRNMGIDTISVASNPMGKPKLPTLYTAQYLMAEGFKVIVHYPLSGRSEVIIKSDMLQAASIGVNKMLVLSGDPHGKRFWSGMCMIDVIKLAKSYGILVGVAADPSDVNHEYLQSKVDAGADYFQTQPVFTMSQALKFLKEIEQYGLPILLGIMIPKSKSHLDILSKIPGIAIPEDYLSTFRNIADRDFLPYALLQANKVIDMVRNIVDGVYISMPQSMFECLREIR
jgi:5,10-methylenetetrahydrofolate reductase